MQTSLGEGGKLFSLISDDGDEISAALKHLLSRLHDEELIMDEAKATGRQLYADLAPEARKQRIDDVVSVKR